MPFCAARSETLPQKLPCSAAEEVISGKLGCFLAMLTRSTAIQISREQFQS